MTPSLLLLLLLAQPQGLDAPPEAAPALASAERWRSRTRGEATTLALLPRGGVGSREGFVRHLFEPLTETCVGGSKEGQPGVRFADGLIIERQPPAGQPPRVESFSFKIKYLGPEVQIRRVRLVYEGGELKPQNADALKQAVPEVQKEVRGVEVLFQ